MAIINRLFSVALKRARKLVRKLARADRVANLVRTIANCTARVFIGGSEDEN